MGLRNKSKYTFKINSYTVFGTEVIGQGAFGVVYRGTDADRNLVVAKRIDEKQHQRILKLNVEKLLSLQHPNVARILDVERKDGVFWMFMHYFELGDLNKLFRAKDLDFSTDFKLYIMIQIACGLEYLHNQNVAHRDLKPGNILVTKSSGFTRSSVLAKLADFDVCRYLNPDTETSAMSSNVGTLAFKAPEFFQRLESGKIIYHRSIDIYACGLTFLAMLQIQVGNKMLIPRIETPQDDSEIHVPSVGQLISERIKYQRGDLDIVKDDRENGNSQEVQLRSLIQKMTKVIPKERVSASKNTAISITS